MQIAVCVSPPACLIISLLPVILTHSDHFQSGQGHSFQFAPNVTSGMSRKVILGVLSVEQDEGLGARVRRSVGRSELRNLDPFLMLDEFKVGAPAGFPDHPHRGFETVTYMLSGSFRHEDFCGHKGTINAGDLQWMTAGRGVVHCEMPHGEHEGHGLQLWVNLAAKDKMVEPAYQELLDKDIPRSTKDGVTVKVIAGESYNGIKSPVYTRTPTLYLDFKLDPGASVSQPLPSGWTVFAYILSGQAIFGGSEGLPHHTLVLGAEGDRIDVENKGSETCHFVLIGGRPLNEPIVQHGPFVMNTEDQIQQAKADYFHERHGFEGARSWNSFVAEEDPITY
ncbi:pirin-like isoform X1 [Haliotis cracherodii]|uniref:pirin-like isoform X1 n=2 Tax=Haliotis cracherodii TaxID=6455 RepID=UPI0039E7E2AC